MPGKHVLLEKPPGLRTTREIALLGGAGKKNVGALLLFQTWHSRFAAGVAPARAWLATHAAQESASVVWKEERARVASRPAMDLGAGELRRPCRSRHQRAVDSHGNPGAGGAGGLGASGVRRKSHSADCRRTADANRRRDPHRGAIRTPAYRRTDLGHRSRDRQWEVSSFTIGGGQLSIDGAAHEPAELRGEYVRLYGRPGG